MRRITHARPKNSTPKNSRFISNRSLLYWLSGITTASAIAMNQTAPAPDSFVGQQFHTYAGESYESYARWCFIFFGTGFMGTLAKYDSIFHAMSKMTEHYLQLTHHTEFKENMTEEGKRRVYFRAETAAQAKEILSSNRSPLPFSLISGEVGLPHVKDATLHPDEPLPNGYTRGVISVTSDLEITQNFGRGEAVIVIVPTRQRLACIAQHATKENEGGEFEYMTGGVHKEDILGIAYRDPKTQEFDRFELNQDYTGKIEALELDPQMEQLIALLPDQQKQAELRGCINYKVDRKKEYNDLLSHNTDSHRQALPERLNRVNEHLSPGVLGALHRRVAQKTGMFKPEKQPGMLKAHNTMKHKPKMN